MELCWESLDPPNKEKEIVGKWFVYIYRGWFACVPTDGIENWCFRQHSKKKRKV